MAVQVLSVKQISGQLVTAIADKTVSMSSVVDRA
jgi:hypothetical protein